MKGIVSSGPNSYIVSGENEFQCDVTIGSYTSISCDFRVLVGPKAQHAPAVFKNAVANGPFPGTSYFNTATCKSGQLIIGSDVWIGAGVTIVTPKIHLEIASGTIIGAGTVLTKSVAPYSIVTGNPGKAVSERFDYLTIQRLLKIKWWDWPKELIEQRIEDFKDVHLFVRKYYGT